MKKLVILLLAAGLLGACGGDDAAEEPPSSADCEAAEAAAEDPCFYRGRAILRGEGDSVLLDVEIAETPKQHEVGLMGRDSLDEDAGMVFVFFEESRGGFWMKNTLIPLSIAFYDDSGTIVDILDMEPCEADPCEIYTPSAPYFGALEVNQGAFEEWDISVGDHLELIQGERDSLFG